MLDNIFWGLLETQIDALKNATGKDANTVLLETVKLLLSNVDCSAETMTDYDKFDIRELFAAYSNVATTAVSFYEAQKDKLDPAALNGKLGQKLDSVASEITAVSSNLTELTETEKVLFEREKELEALKSEYESLDEKATSLRAVHDTMTPEIIARMKSEIDSLEDQIKKSSKEHGKLKEKLQETEAEYNNICKDLSQLSDEKEARCAELIAIIKEHYNTLKILFEAEQTGINDMLAKIEAYKGTYSRMETTVKETADVLSMYELQMGENSKVVESMKKYGVKSLSSALDDIDRIKQTIEDDLKAYDLILKSVLLHEEDIRKEIERRQGLNV